MPAPLRFFVFCCANPDENVRIMALLAAWDDWSIYPPLYITGLEASFMRKSGDLEAKDLTGVEESSLDKEALAQKANQV